MFGTPLGPTGDALVRRRPARPRRLLAHDLRRARLAAGRHRRHRRSPCWSASPSASLAGYYRGWVDTLLSRLIDVMLSFPVLLLGLGIASPARSGNGCVGGRHNAGRAHGDPRDRARHLDVDRARRARSGAVAARARVRRRRAVAGRLEPPHRHPRDPPEPHCTDHCLLKSAAPADDLARGGALVPGRRRVPADGELGLDDRRRIRQLRHAVVVHGLSRRGAAAHRACVQPAR